MGEYFTCELRLGGTKETFVKEVYLRTLPRVGEHIQTVLKHDNKPHNFLIQDIWHFAGDQMTAHKVVIYVSHI